MGGARLIRWIRSLCVEGPTCFHLPLAKKRGEHTVVDQSV